MRQARLKWLRLLAAGLLGILLSWAAYAFLTWRTPLDLTRLGGYTVEQLIDGLQDEGSEGLDTHSTAWAEGFLAGDDEPTFRGGILGSAEPAVSPVMRELARRGVTALPDLVDHLEDRRPTAIEIKLPFGGFGTMWHSDEYHARSQDAPRRLKDVNSGGRGRERYTDGTYRVSVGDLCYVLVGQIVNRSLNVVRYQPSACVVINSPVETPGLAAAVRSDWGGLTPEQHKRSLAEDANDESEHARRAALVRLRFYYPEAAAPVVAEEVERKLPKGDGF